jgi:deoxyribose-phosphate aldolase
MVTFLKAIYYQFPQKSTLFTNLIVMYLSNLQKTGYKIGFKPAGGIRSAKEALTWLALMKEELGDEWTHPNLFRIGASSLLLDIERQLFHFVTGR